MLGRASTVICDCNLLCSSGSRSNMQACKNYYTKYGEMAIAGGSDLARQNRSLMFLREQYGKTIKGLIFLIN